jgi:hypothetical protein
MSSLLRRTSRPALRFLTALYVASFGLLTTLCLGVPAHAAAADEAVFTPEALAQLEQRAIAAKPREQCFLYTELVHAMTAKAGKELSDGDTDQAADTLKQVNRYAHMIHMNLAHDTKKIKDAQMLMNHTTYRLAQYLHLVSGDDQQTVKDTLKQLNQVNDELLTQVFQH